MKAKELLKKVCTLFIDIESCGIVPINEVSPVSGWFSIADECEVEEGEYFYVYLDSDSEMKETEKFFGQPFDYAFPLRDEVPTTAWVGLLKIEE